MMNEIAHKNGAMTDDWHYVQNVFQNEICS